MMLSSILVVLDEHVDNKGMIALAAELAGPSQAMIVVTDAARCAPSVGGRPREEADASATRVRSTVEQLRSVGLAARVATPTETHDGNPSPFIATIAAIEQADLIISASEDASSLRRFLPGVAADGVLRSRNGLITVVHSSDRGEQVREGQISTSAWRGIPSSRTGVVARTSTNPESHEEEQRWTSA
jgi:nucleotide-binding universal stress UspA family protein